MDAAAAEKFASELVPVHLPRRSQIYTQDDPSDRLYLIITGKVKASTGLSTDEELILTVFGHAEFFGLIAAFDFERRESSATALTDVCVLPIERELITSWIAKDPQVGLQLLRILARRTRKLTTLRYEARAGDASPLVAKRLIELAQNFGVREGEVVRVPHGMTLHDLPSWRWTRQGCRLSSRNLQSARLDRPRWRLFGHTGHGATQ